MSTAEEKKLERKRKAIENQNRLAQIYRPSKRRTKETVKTTGDCHCCADAYTYRNYKIVCPYACQYECCIKCAHRYLTSTTLQPHCMNCRKEWSLMFMDATFPKNIVTDLQQHQHTILVASDRVLLPEAQVVLENAKHVEKIDDKIRYNYHEIEVLRQANESLYNEKRQFSNSHRGKTPTASAEKCVKCPMENCRGFLKKGLCGVCNRRTCMKCFQEKSVADDDGEASSSSEPHVCRPDDLVNAEYLRQNTKACPSCGVRTSKTDGCDQMFCVQCHKAWNWRTELEEKGAIHNPHFFEWQQRTGGRVPRNPLDVQCGGLPDRWHNNNHRWPYETLVRFNRILRAALHIRDIHVQRNIPVAANTLPIRVKYLRGEIDEKMWGSFLFKHHSVFLRRREFYNLHQMFDAAITDIIQRTQMAIRKWTPEAEKEFLVEYEMLRQYYNSELFRYCQRFGGKSKDMFEYIGDDWGMLSPNDVPFVEKLKSQVEAEDLANRNLARK